MKKQFKLMLGDNMESLKKLPDNSIDSVVSDPPYGLSFMGKKWDYDVPSVEFWKEVYRVLKPGGHVLSFGGTRTYHRMVVNIEDAGFEIRDQIMWIYGSGFPKSHNIGKAVDKIEGNEREVVGIKENWASFSDPRLKEQGSFMGHVTDRDRTDLDITKGSSPHEGWGTALKPANEPICVARKPLSEKSVAENVLKWGTGGINIDGCRIGSEILPVVEGKVKNNGDIFGAGSGKNSSDYVTPEREGRFPANIIFDESAAEMLDEQSGITKTKADLNYKHNKTESSGEVFQSRGTYTPREDKGGASRFFYIPKVSKSERNMGLDGFPDIEETLHSGFNSRDESGNKLRNDGSIIPPLVAKNTHPTLKPVQLMAYLCRLVTPPNGIVLDPFMGSGSTGISACLEGFRFVGMEMSEEYFKIAEARIENYELYRPFVEKKKKK